ncbi:MAG: hypothetical protein OEV92_07070 [Nitrospinota bacterium]|nr:hypothetical protein [Nitrospinota bacterium]
MNTLFDFITHVKGVEYLLAIGFIGLFILIWEALSPRPFKAMLAAGREDLEYIGHGGFSGVIRSAGHAASAPFLLVAYLATIPLAFLAGLAISARLGLRRWRNKR